MFKIHVCSKTIIPLFYSVIEIIRISRILNQQSTLHHSINYQLAFSNMQNYLKITEPFIVVIHFHHFLKQLIQLSSFINFVSKV
jgi:hypothetical protein